MRPDAERVADIVDSAQAIIDRLARHSFESFAGNPEAVKAAFYDVIVIGEAIRDLVAKRNPSGETIGEDAPIVKAHPEIPWVDWIGMRDMVTHQYYRAAPEMLWRDHASGDVGRLLDCCKAWLGRSSSGPAR